MKTNLFARISVASALFLVFIGSAVAQNQGGFNKYEFFGGFSHNRVDTKLESDDFETSEDFGSRIGTNGVNLQFTGNFTKYVGAKFDYAHHRKSDDFTFDGVTVDQKYTNDSFMGGIQVKNNSKEGPRFKPFFHALAGVARQKLNFVADSEDFDESVSQSNFTFALGGGLDIKASKRVDVRVFQFDYNPTYIKDFTVDGIDFDGRMQNNFRFGFGIVIH
jgi:opacity protein-like surface antigen